MSGRHFASTEVITSTTTAGMAGFTYQYGTIAVVFSTPVVSTAQTLVTVGSAAQPYHNFYFTNHLALYTGAVSTPVAGSGLTLAADIRYIAVFTKAAGTVVGRFHLHNFSTGVWSHANGDVATVDAGTPTQIAYGNWAGAAGDPRDIWALAVWPGQVMGDREVERLSSGEWGRWAPPFWNQESDGREAGDVARTLGRYRVTQTSRTGSTRGALVAPPGFRMGPQRRRR